MKKELTYRTINFTPTQVKEFIKRAPRSIGYAATLQIIDWYSHQHLIINGLSNHQYDKAATLECFIQGNY